MKSVTSRVKKHRDHLRTLGLRPIQIWVPDARKQGFGAECQRQSRLIKNDQQEQTVLNWITAVSDNKDWI